MSGTSLDGVDLAACEFNRQDHSWTYRVLATATTPYPVELKQALLDVENGTARELAQLHTRLGHHYGKLARNFIQQNHLSPILIASHGQTIFHQPQQHYTTQIGDGAALAAVSGIPTACDFRATDVALGGQGAPLVPVGDALLYPHFDACLNLGGFANISLDNTAGQRIAFDISPANMPLNQLARQLQLEFDPDGQMARKGQLIPSLLNQLNALSFYQDLPPKSLGREWYLAHFAPLLSNHEKIEDLLHTCVHHISDQLATTLNNYAIKRVLVTGGGALNGFLMECLQQKTTAQLHLPDKTSICFKEAIIFAFLGLLRYLQTPNCWTSVSGASKNSIGGAIYLPGQE